MIIVIYTDSIPVISCKMGGKWGYLLEIISILLDSWERIVGSRNIN